MGLIVEITQEDIDNTSHAHWLADFYSEGHFSGPRNNDGWGYEHHPIANAIMRQFGYLYAFLCMTNDFKHYVSCFNEKVNRSSRPIKIFSLSKEAIKWSESWYEGLPVEPIQFELGDSV